MKVKCKCENAEFEIWDDREHVDVKCNKCGHVFTLIPREEPSEAIITM